MEIKIHRSVLVISVIVLIISAFLLYLRFIGSSGLVVREYRVKNSNIGPYSGLKIVHFSDLHYKTTFNSKDFNNMVEKINYINPDIVVFTGDIFDSKLKYSDNDIITLNGYFKKINAKIKKYIIRGDADNELFDRVVQNSDFVVLDNNYDLVYAKDSRPILIAGIDSGENVTDNLLRINEYLLSDQSDQYYSILLSHKPDYIKYTNSFDLVLSGHSMNGQIRLPFVGGLIKVDGALSYYDEHYKVDKTDLYISGGLGSKDVNLRLSNKPSINFYRIVAE